MSILVALIGLCIGSFLNVLADRLPKGQNVLWGRSRCDHCKRNLRWYELVPVVSYVFLYGKCLRCKKAISIQYPLVECMTAIGFVFLYVQYFTSTVVFVSSCVIFSSFLVMFVADFKYQIIPDSMIVIGTLGTVLLAFQGHSQSVLAIHCISGIGALAFFFLLWLITRGRGIGLGDVKLSFLLGLLLGYPQTIVALYIAFLTGALAGVILILARIKSLKSKIAFGPFLIMGTVIVIVFHAYIVNIWNILF
jgi:leader peptidase (prepilin peptidase)/N-methyltransferase